MQFSYDLLAQDQSNLTTSNCQTNDPSLTGRQLLEQNNYFPTCDYQILQLLENGMLEEINLEESIDIKGIENTSFFIFKSDRTYSFKLNERRYPWGDKYISAKALRCIGNIPSNHKLWLDKQTEADDKINKDTCVNLEGTEVERIYSKAPSWKLKVNGVTVKSDTQCIVASDAIDKAGFNANEDWIIILRIKDQPKKKINITDSIDLSQPGIEKLRIVQKEINNGEKSHGTRTEFSLLEKDIVYLSKLGIQFETIVDQSKRWLLISDYQLPKGFNHKSTNIAIMIPSSYPAALLDMFFCYPHLTMECGAIIPKTESRMYIEGISYQRWSRHLGASRPWNPSTDSVMTHLALVEESLLREVEK